MKQLSSRTRRILELARDQDRPEPTAITRVERSLSRRIALGAALVGGTPAAKAATGAGLMLTVAKSAGVAGVVVGVAVLAYRVGEPDTGVPSGSERAVQVERRAVAGAVSNSRFPDGDAATVQPRGDTTGPSSDVHPTPALLDAQRLVKDRREAPFVPSTPSQTGGEPSSRANASVDSNAPKPEGPDRLALETGALREAQQALRNGEPERALALLDEQDGRYAGGALLQERSAARVMALCQGGQVQKARQLAERFERSFPGSPLLSRVRSACVRQRTGRGQ